MNNERKQPTYLPNGKPVMGPGTGNIFSKTNQPAPELKRAGHLKNKLFREVLEAPLSPTGTHAEMIQKAAEYLQKEIGEISLSDLMHFRMAQKAIQKQDVFAYQAVMDRAFGKPESKTTLANDENHPITPLSAEQVNLFINKIKTGGVGEGMNVQTSNIEEAQVIENKEDK